MLSLRRAYFLFSLLNSIGSATLLLLVSAGLGGLESFGLAIGFMAFGRQVGYMYGTAAAGAFINPSLRFIVRLLTSVELGILGVTIAAGILISATRPETYTTLALAWALIRFFLAGLSSNFSFRLLGDMTSNWSVGAVLETLISQGSLLFGAVGAFLISRTTPQPLVGALAFDIATSILLWITLLILGARSEGDARGRVPGASKVPAFLSVLVSPFSALKRFWRPDLFPWNLLMLIYLLAVAGNFTFIYGLAAALQFGSSKYNFLAAIGIYSAGTWIGGWMLSRNMSRGWVLCLGSGALAAYPIVYLFNDRSTVTGALAALLLMVIGFWMLFHFFQFETQRHAKAETAGQIRSATMVTLSVVFAFGEPVVGWIVTMSHGLESLLWIKACVAGCLPFAWIVLGRMRTARESRL